MRKTKDITVAFHLCGQTLRLWWGDWVNSVLVSLVMILTSLTVILAGPALMGVCAVAADLADGVRTGIAGWWVGFKRYFWQGLIWGCVNMGLLFIFAVGLWFYTQVNSIWAPLFIMILLATALFWGAIQFYVPGYLMVQVDKSLGLAWKNSFLTVLSAPGMTLVLFGVALMVLLASLGLFVPAFLGTGPVLGLLSVLAVRNRIEWHEAGKG